MASVSSNHHNIHSTKCRVEGTLSPTVIEECVKKFPNDKNDKYSFSKEAFKALHTAAGPCSWGCGNDRCVDPRNGNYYDECYDCLTEVAKSRRCTTYGCQKPSTFWKPTGCGDLCYTCANRYSDTLCSVEGCKQRVMYRRRYNPDTGKPESIVPKGEKEPTFLLCKFCSDRRYKAGETLSIADIKDQHEDFMETGHVEENDVLEPEEHLDDFPLDLTYFGQDNGIYYYFSETNSKYYGYNLMGEFLFVLIDEPGCITPRDDENIAEYLEDCLFNVDLSHPQDEAVELDEYNPDNDMENVDDLYDEFCNFVVREDYGEMED